VEDLKILLSSTDKTSRQNFNNYLRIKQYMDKMDLIDIYRVFHSSAANYTFSQQPMELFPK
jgi:hypothetical protein